LKSIHPIRTHLDSTKSELLTDLATGLPDLRDVEALIDATLVAEPPIQIADGGVIRVGRHAELDELRDAASGGREWVAGLQTREREATGIPSLKVSYNRAFGYYIEVTRANLDKVPETFIRKQTLVNAERFITPDLKDWEAKILGADDRAKALEKDLFFALREEVSSWVAPIQTTARSIATADVLCSFSEVSKQQDFVRPTVDDGASIEISDGRHPVIETLLPAGSFVANDVNVDGESDQILIITGPNMAGKSTILRLTGLVVLLSQVGCFVPATKAHIGIADRIFTRVGASDNLARGESTFLVEMNEAANILNNATEKSLVLLDEIGRGTSTFDGLSIAWAMTEYLHNSDVRPRTLFATHYHELTELEDLLPRVRNYSVAVQERADEIVFLHTLVKGGCDHSYGIQVAQLAGMPKNLIEDAKRVLARLEQNDLSVTQSAVRHSRRASNGQISLFEATGETTAHPVLVALEAMNVDEMTPVEALVKLEALKREATNIVD
jgi:DNA mismatch repair protein MutS